MSKRMITGFIVVLCLLASAGLSAAETLYVSEDFEITLRTGPGTDRKILAMVPSGRMVELINKGDEWSEVRLPNGKEGWVLNRYLSPTVPSAIQLSRLETKHADTLAQNQDLNQKVSVLTAENQALSTQLKEVQAALATMEGDFETLKKGSAGFIKLKSDFEKNLKELTETRQKAERTESQLNRLAGSQLYEGMLYGGGLIIFGFVAGFILKRPKRRSPLM